MPDNGLKDRRPIKFVEARGRHSSFLEKAKPNEKHQVGGYGGYQAIKVEMHDGQRVYLGASESRQELGVEAITPGPRFARFGPAPPFLFAFYCPVGKLLCAEGGDFSQRRSTYENSEISTPERVIHDDLESRASRLAF